MSDMTQIEIFLARLAKDAQGRREDLTFEVSQRYDQHDKWLYDAITVLDKLRSVLIQEREHLNANRHSVTGTTANALPLRRKIGNESQT